MIFELAWFISPVSNWFWRRTNDVRSRIFHARTWKTKKYSSIEKMKFDGASDVLCATGERKVDKKWTGYIARKKAKSGAKSSGWTDGLHSGSMQREKKITLALEPAMRLAYSCAGYLEFSGVWPPPPLVVHPLHIHKRTLWCTAHAYVLRKKKKEDISADRWAPILQIDIPMYINWHMIYPFNWITFNSSLSDSMKSFTIAFIFWKLLSRFGYNIFTVNF